MKIILIQPYRKTNKKVATKIRIALYVGNAIIFQKKKNDNKIVVTLDTDIIEHVCIIFAHQKNIVYHNQTRFKVF